MEEWTHESLVRISMTPLLSRREVNHSHGLSIMVQQKKLIDSIAFKWHKSLQNIFGIRIAKKVSFHKPKKQVGLQIYSPWHDNSFVAMRQVFWPTLSRWGSHTPKLYQNQSFSTQNRYIHKHEDQWTYVEPQVHVMIWNLFFQTCQPSVFSVGKCSNTHVKTFVGHSYIRI